MLFWRSCLAVALLRPLSRDVDRVGRTQRVGIERGSQATACCMEKLDEQRRDMILPAYFHGLDRPIPARTKRVSFSRETGSLRLIGNGRGVLLNDQPLPVSILVESAVAATDGDARSLALPGQPVSVCADI